MDMLESKSRKELLESLLAESAKATNELKCSQRDINKALGRIQFVVMVINELLTKEQQ